MARFLMWIASFFTLSIFIFWTYVGLTKITWKEKDFLQVQSEHHKQLGSLIPNLEKSLTTMKTSSKEKVLNKNQCAQLLGKLILVVKGIDQMLSSATKDLKFQSIFEELSYLQKKVEIVVQTCTQQKQWCHSVVFQFQNKETFCELLLDLKCCYDTARDMYLFHHPNQSNDFLLLEFDTATYKEVLEDVQELKKKLELALQGEMSKDHEIVEHLLLRLRNLDRVDGGDLNALEVPNGFETLRLLKRIGNGSFGDVYKSIWSDLSCATKVLKGDPQYLVACQKEAGILAGFSHPNLVQFYGCGITHDNGGNSKKEEISAMHWKEVSFLQPLKNLVNFLSCRIIQRIDDNPKKDEIGEMYLVMELMDSNLSSFLKKVNGPLLYSFALDIMLQIAKGVYYPHDMQVAHLDLKPDNVLCTSIPMEDLDPCCTFKVMDYGASQLEVYSNEFGPDPSQYTIGTPRYMAPEMIQGSQTPRYPFQADVWSFAMICSEILSGQVPYADLEPRELKDQIQGPHGPSLRPTLPNDCEELTILIQECWSQDPLQQPTFSKICDKLTDLKKLFWKGECGLLRDFKSIVHHVPKVDEPIGSVKRTPIDLDH